MAKESESEIIAKFAAAMIGGLILTLFDGTRGGGIFIFLGAAIALAIRLAWKSAEGRALEARQEKALASAERLIASTVNDHIDTLADRRHTLVRQDRYGVVDAKDWNREVQHFFDKVVLPKLSAQETKAVAKANVSDVMKRLLDDRVAEHGAKRDISRNVPEGITPLDFEVLCASAFKKQGWAAWTTQGSGDQGADVIAQYKQLKVVVQCKLYAGKVGNKAVQEVHAAKTFYGADMALVVCKVGYTISAQQLAQSSRVTILTYDELSDFAETLRKSLQAQAAEQSA
ncbi:restriction endonuclease [Henriciella barbarensis]|uniref:Restriction endonuclease n=1 Tax=Henriciella barbarensis TaxID=86342 RepID=A0A399QZ38_9PROT|nr:restriction endonuclease [Henriciella barbarensis]RIJ23811.1 restriction endonuclease [Henriciella barbarensis]